MDRMLYIGMSGAKETLLAQGLNSNNLANASTVGFRQDLEQARSMPVFGPGLPTRVYAMTERPGIDFTPGPIENTGRDLDIAIEQNGWIAIEAADGTEAYTRAGDLRVSATGQLVNGVGNPVMGNGGPIVIPPAQGISIGRDGSITIQPIGEGADALVVVDRIKLVNPAFADMEKGRDGLFRQKNGLPADADANVNLVPGALERSNVSVVESMVKMIELSRHFEMQTKVMSSAEEAAQATDMLLRMN
ncbi:MAG: flagellar basal body rod protein FlgF [Gammaproteobacteria bacterium]|nr:flagellar basal body rod protein FlgF [Gammaproteobacteria bacterium]